MINNNEIIKKVINYKKLNSIRKNVNQSIRCELMIVIAISFAISFGFYGISNRVLREEVRDSEIIYRYDYIDSDATYTAQRIQESSSEITLQNDTFFKELFDGVIGTSPTAKAYITDLDGNVIHKSKNAIENKVDIFALIASNSLISDYRDNGMEKKIVYPVNVGNERAYFVYSDTPHAEIQENVYEVNHSFLVLILTGIVFVVTFIIITNRKVKYLDEIANGLRVIAKGDLDYRIDEKGHDEIRNIASNINNMAEEINKKILAERLAEKTKVDLITNVSHDLRTPLTSIMGYIGLVKEGRYGDEDTMKSYLDISFNKAEKLKVLIEDLFEYTKLNNDGIKINKIEVNLSEFLFQLIEELTPIFEENELTVVRKTLDENIIVKLDPDKMVRVFENLLTNAIKYSYKPGEIIVEVYRDDIYGIVAIRNKGNNISEEKISKLFDRFYRVDESRNAQTGGSGLGLAISKNIVELHDGQIWAECYKNDISFFVKLKTSR